MRFSFHRGLDQRTLSAEELAGDVEGLASHDNDLLAVEELLGDCAGEATEQVTLAVNDNLQEASVGFSSPGADSCECQGPTYDWLEGRHLAQVCHGTTGEKVSGSWCLESCARVVVEARRRKS